MPRVKEWIGFTIWLAAMAGLVAMADGNRPKTIDEVAKEAAQTLKQGAAYKLKTRGKPKVVRWEDLDAAWSKIAARMDYTALEGRLRELLSKDTGFAPNAETVTNLIEKTLAQHEVPYTDLFTLDDNELLPVTNNVLKYLPDDAWKDVPVYKKTGEPLGQFIGKFPHEKSGGLVASKSYRIFYFQYRDKDSFQQAVTPDYLNRDEFCVKWADVKNRPALSLATLKP